MMDHRFEKRLNINLNYIFFYKFNKEDEEWKIFDKENQILLNRNFKNFINERFNLIGKFKFFSIDFSRKLYTNNFEKDENEIYIDIKKVIFINSSEVDLETYQNNKFFFLWEMNSNSIKNSIWVQFDIEDQIYLTIADKKYDEDESESIVFLKSNPDNFVDISSMNLNSLIHNFQIKIVIRRFIDGFVKKNNLKSNIIDSESFTISSKIHKIEGNIKEIISKLKNNSKKISFRSPNLNFQIEIDEEFCFFSDEFVIDIPINQLKKILSMEITMLGKFYNCNNTLLLYQKQIEKIENEDGFFKTILNLYTKEGFLYKTMNEILRSGKNTEYIYFKYYYTFLLLSFQHFSRNIIRLFNNLEGDLILYRGSKVTENEFQQYQDKENNTKIRIFREFLSTTYDKNIAFMFLNFDNSEIIEFFWEITIPNKLLMSEPFNFCDISNLGDYHYEKEILIKGGSVMIINEIVPFQEKLKNKLITYKNKYRKKCTLLSFSVSSLDNMYF